jgi:CDP-2,3-bis-(O-geranylgeranyl)-sn-glycerol synthase
MQPANILEMLILLMLANGMPVLAKKILDNRFSYPMDAGVRFVDGNRLFGPSKTIRGIVLAVLATAAGATLMGLDWMLGALVGGTAMLGDLFSSFIKRRLGMTSSSEAPGLDQIPEALFPLIACRSWLALGLGDILVVLMLFCAGEIVLSRVLFAVGLRDRPY